MIQVGLTAIESWKKVFKSAGLTDEQMNEILEHVKDNSVKRRAISAAIAFGA